MKLETWGWWSIAVNVLLAALHGAIALRSGSLAVTAELVHNLVDLLSAVAVLVGLKLAVRRARAFPYGLYKVENLVAAGLAVMVFVTGYEVLRRALWAGSAPVRVDGWMLATLLATAVVPLLFSHFELRAGRAANSPALIADATEYRVHVLTTGLAFAALAAERLRLPIDRIAAALIVAAVFKTGWDLLRDAMRVLLDASLDRETLAAIDRIIRADPAVTEAKWITGRNAGRFRFVEAGVSLRVGESEKVSAVTARIERNVRMKVPHVERVLLHVEAPESPAILCAVPLDDREGTVSAHFGEAPYFALLAVRRRDGALEERRIVANPHAKLLRAKGIRVAQWLVEQKVDVVLSHEDLRGKGPVFVLRDAGVDLRRSDARSLDEVIASLADARPGGAERASPLFQSAPPDGSG
jgi:cation diffusion facilitator family transporter